MDQFPKEQKKKSLKVRVGEPFRITLWEDRTHGYSWHPQLDSLPIDLIDDDYEQTIHVDTADSGKRTFEFICSQAGRFEIMFENRVGWQFSANGYKTFVVEAEGP